MGIGKIIAPLIITLLIHELGYLGSIVVYSGILMNTCVVTALFREPQKRHLAKLNSKSTIIANETSSIDQKSSKSFKTICSKDSYKLYIFTAALHKFRKCLATLTSFHVVINGVGVACFSVGFLNFSMFIPYAMLEQGFGYGDAALALSTAAPWEGGWSHHALIENGSRRNLST